MKLIPTKKQFSGWTLPSKITYLGFILAIIAIILTLILYCLSSKYGATKSGQKEIKDAIVKTSENEKEAINIIAIEMQKLRTKFGDKIDRDKLISKYNLGYVIFKLNYKESVSPYDTYLTDQYNLDCSVIKLQFITKTAIELRLPDLYDKNGKAIITNATTGGPFKIGNLGGYMVDNISVWGEILEIKESGVVFLVGFEKNVMNFQKMHLATELTKKLINIIHILYNRGDVESIWALTDNTFRNVIKYNSFEKTMKEMHNTFGEFNYSIDTKSKFEDNDQGSTVTINQKTIFQKKDTFEIFIIIIRNEKPYLVGWNLLPPKKDKLNKESKTIHLK